MEGAGAVKRQIIFDAFRKILGRGFTGPEVEALDRAIDQAIVSVPAPAASNILHPSKAITDYVKGVEKLAKLRADGKVEAYMPTPNDRPTIGYGTTGTDVKMGTVWTVEQAEKRFTDHFAEFAAGVRTVLGAAPTSQRQFDAMLSLAYNIGLQAFRESTLLRLHKEGKYAEAKGQFGRWNKQAGAVLKGLTIRRQHEAEVYG